MRLLFIHQNCPGQFKHLIKKFASLPEHEVACIGNSANMVPWDGVPGVRLHGYSGPPEQPEEKIHPYLRDLPQFVRRGQAVARTALEIKKSGFMPEVIVAHTGWGEALYLKDIFPEAKILSYCEFYYNAEGSDVDFERRGVEQRGNVFLDTHLLTRSRNFTQALSFISSDWGLSPTAWQKQQYPDIIQQRISVIHDGIDTDLIRPDPEAQCVLRDKPRTRLKAGDEVITFISRNLEPYRGFHIFTLALPLIQKLRPKAHIVIVGGDGVSYGRRPPEGTTFRKLFMDQVAGKVDMSRIYFTGYLPYEHFLKILQISAAHVYLTYPFVLSWSMLEAMSAGCLVIGSRTPPVEEVLKHEENGLLVDFFSVEELANAVDSALANPERMNELRQNARKTIIEKYDLHNVCLPKQMDLINALAQGNLPG
jgi:glycosyltransferase involved in cell wall biosynthesis